MRRWPTFRGLYHGIPVRYLYSFFSLALSAYFWIGTRMSFSSRLARAAVSSNSRNLRAWSRVSSTGGARFVSSSTPVPAATVGGLALKELAEANPYKDVVRYQHKNRKWNLQHVDYYSEALAIGFLETGLQPGDVVLSWLPAHFSESVSEECSKVQWGEVNPCSCSLVDTLIRVVLIPNL